MDQVLVIGENKIQYFVAQFLAKRDFDVSYYGTMSYEKPQGVKYLKDFESLKRLLDNPECVVILPFHVILATAKETGDERLPKEIRGSEKEYNVINVTDVTNMSCKFWHPDNIELVKARLADLLAEAAIVEVKLLSQNKIAGSVSVLFGFDVYGEKIAEKIRAWGGRVVVIPDEEEEYQLASYRGYCVWERSSVISQLQYAGDKIDYVFQCSCQQRLLDGYISFLPVHCVVLNITPQYQAVDMRSAAKKHICAKHAGNLLLEYAPAGAAAILTQQIIEDEKT